MPTAAVWKGNAADAVEAPPTSPKSPLSLPAAVAPVYPDYFPPQVSVSPSFSPGAFPCMLGVWTALHTAKPTRVRDLTPQEQSSTNDWRKVVDKCTLASHFLSGKLNVPRGIGPHCPVATCSLLHSLLAIFLFSVSHFYFLTFVSWDHISKSCQHPSPILESTPIQAETSSQCLSFKVLNTLINKSLLFIANVIVILSQKGWN